VKDSAPGGNGSGTFDPGETGQLVVTISNIARDAQNVTARLRSYDSRFRITDSSSSLGDIPFLGTRTNDADRFAVAVSESMPWGTPVVCSLFVQSANWAHGWAFSFVFQVGDIRPPARQVVTLDTGTVAVSVGGPGTIGYLAPGGEGKGFQVPKDSSSCVRYGAVLAGNSPEYVVDCFYGRPSSATNRDWQMTDSFRFVLPPAPADEQWENPMLDAGHPTPKGLVAEQHWYMNSDPGCNDFAVVTYNFKNEGLEPLDSMYAGVIVDFNIGKSATVNNVYSDTAMRLIYMRDIQSYTAAGLVLLEPRRFANLSAIDHSLYVNPSTAMTDTQKYEFLSGGIVQRQSSRSYDWSVIASVGPFDLAVGAEYKASFAIAGATNPTLLFSIVDSAQHWFDANLAGIGEGGLEPIPEAGTGLCPAPNPFSRGTTVRYFSPDAGPAELRIFDAGGRQVERTVFDTDEGLGRYFWQPRGLSPGVYFLKLRTPGNESAAKVLLLD